MAAQALFPGAVFAFGCRLAACAKNAAHGRSAQTEGLVCQCDALLRAHTQAPCTLPLPPQHNNTAHRATAACPPSCGTDTHLPTLIIEVSAPRGDLPSPDVPSPAGQAGWGHSELESHVPARSPCTQLGWRGAGSQAGDLQDQSPPCNASLHTAT